MEQVLTELQKIGFSQYEARAYVALLQHAPVTGYELSKRSGVPRSMIYEVLGKLIDRGAVYIVPAEPVTYAPVAAQELIARLRRAAEETFDSLETSLATLEQPSDVTILRLIRGQEPLLAEFHALIERAQHELWLSLWNTPVPLPEEALARVEGRDTDVIVAQFAHEPLNAENQYSVPGGHPLIAARDGQEALIGNFPRGGVPWAIKTQDPGLVALAIDYVRHDVMLGSAINAFGMERFREVWRQNPHLFRIITGQKRTE